MRFRRRPLRRRLFRPRFRPVRRKLREAQKSMQAGRPAEAGKGFAEIARAAAEQNRPVASQLFLRAARAYLAAGDIETAEPLVMQGLHLMLELGDPRLVPISQRLMAELRDQGYPDLAQAIEKIIPANVGMAQQGPLTTPLPQLPAKCPYCGSSVHADEVDRTDPERPACAYCGTPLLGDERAHE